MGHLGSIIAILVVGSAITWAGSQESLVAGGLPIFAICAGFSFVVNWLVFIPAYTLQTEKYFDLTGSLTYLSILALSLALVASPEPRAILLAAMIAAWALRLGSFLFLRIHAAGSDGRFDRIKPNFLWFLMAWTLQGLWVLLTMSCALAAITSATPAPLGLPALVGFALWVVGFAVEVTADRQKTAFRADPANRDRFITTGLWAHSRHPNYLGEITLWVGVALVSLPVLSGWSFVTLISPVFVFVLLTRISGIPLLEGRANKKWGDDPEFQAYLARTPRLVPGFSSKR